MNEIEVERLRELALEQQEIIEILRQAVKVMEFSSSGIDASWKIGKIRFWWCKQIFFVWFTSLDEIRVMSIVYLANNFQFSE